MEEVITKKYKIFTILAGILTLIPVLNIIFIYIGINNTWPYILSFYALKVVGLSIYYFILKNFNKNRIILFYLSIGFLLVSILWYFGMINDHSVGMNSLGVAIGNSILMGVNIIIYYILAFLLYMSYAKKFIFKKYAIIRAIMVLLLAVLLYFAFNNLRVSKVDESKLPTIKAFENELLSRKICKEKCITSDNVKLYGLKKGLEIVTDLDFESDYNEKYPMLVYVTEEKKDDNNWIIYYINGNLYAVYGYYYVISDGEIKIKNAYPKLIVSESDYVITYDPYKNNFVKTKNLINGLIIYDDKNGNSITIDNLESTNMFFNSFYKKVVERIDNSTLNQISQD